MRDPNTPFRVLAVCLGNICRSPLAEALLSRAAQANGLEWEVDSAGTGGWHVGAPPDPRGQAVAKQYGLDISKQRGRRLKAQDLDDYDLILAMDSRNLETLQSFAAKPEQKDKIKLLLAYAELEEAHGPDVFDPYWDDSRFEEVFLLIENAANRVAEKVRHEWAVNR